ncbi:hypothetical protein KXQ82_10430 [Mucilaginibacter sp. HMF5004]|uniref:hypothetical protein n=1 Tax=Mucilaginibacter rivuli TaxID=2857527 RepID=UPI001C5D8C74|nr:hypothetical protein [Mucilaginibacter rivuli]MBW4890135.1 hypothetical protein [Mucilaginibacter rivuli]
MKKIIIIILLCAVTASLKAQYGTEVIATPSAPVYVYLGSLPVTNANNLHKLKVDILGGAWESYATGETTFYISNRNSLKIDQVTLGSTNGGNYTLHGYTNSTGGIDFYLLTYYYTAIAVKSCMVGGNPTQLITNTTSTSAPTGVTEITPLTINPVLITDDQGNIGINTNIPNQAYKLSVNGSIRSKEIKVETGWADYVFDKDYKLRPLKNVAQYIDKNKHLPEVPSAAEVRQNGINVGETEALLLKKIEELTLYLIEQQKINQSLQRQINELKKN